MNIIVRETASELRQLGRFRLKDHWGKAIMAVVLFYAMIMLVPGLVSKLVPAATISLEEVGAVGNMSYLSGLYSFLLTGAFTLGLSVFFLSFVRNMDLNPGYIFYGFEYFIKSFLLSFFIGLFVVLWSFLFIIPGIIAYFRYSQAFFILADDPTKGIFQCIAESKAMMAGNKAKLFFTQLSFIGWFFLASIPTALLETLVPVPSAMAVPVANGAEFTAVGLLVNFVLQIPMYIVTTYMLTTKTVFYELVSGHLKKQVNQPDMEV